MRIKARGKETRSGEPASLDRRREKSRIQVRPRSLGPRPVGRTPLPATGRRPTGERHRGWPRQAGRLAGGSIESDSGPRLAEDGKAALGPGAVPLRHPGLDVRSDRGWRKNPPPAPLTECGATELRRHLPWHESSGDPDRPARSRSTGGSRESARHPTLPFVLSPSSPCRWSAVSLSTTPPRTGPNPMKSPRFPATGAVVVMILVLTASWLIVQHVQGPDIEASASQDRSPVLPPPSQTARNNNEIMRVRPDSRPARDRRPLQPGSRELHRRARPVPGEGRRTVRPGRHAVPGPRRHPHGECQGQVRRDEEAARSGRGAARLRFPGMDCQEIRLHLQTAGEPNGRGARRSWRASSGRRWPSCPGPAIERGRFRFTGTSWSDVRWDSSRVICPWSSRKTVLTAESSRPSEPRSKSSGLG